MPIHWNWAEGPGGNKLPFAELEGSSPGPTWLLAAAVHGDEYEGPEAIRQAVSSLSDKNFPGKVIALPITNPMAYAKGVRSTPEDQGNLNRFFPGRPEGSLTPRWAHWLWQTFIGRADRLIDLHAGGSTWEFDSLAGFYTDEDAPLAAVFGLILWRVPNLPGILSQEFRRLRGPAIGVELGFGGTRREALVQLTRQALVRLVRGETARVAAPIYHSQNITAPQAGEWTPARRLRDRVAEGDLLGTITDWTAENSYPVRSPSAGLLLAVRRLVSIEAGDLVAMLGRRETGDQ